MKIGIKVTRDKDEDGEVKDRMRYLCKTDFSRKFFKQKQWEIFFVLIQLWKDVSSNRIYNDYQKKPMTFSEDNVP